MGPPRGRRDRLGSSPLTRGKHTRREITRDEHGLIPAHAGKTSAAVSMVVISSAHPRSRGENRRCGSWSWSWSGSSPLTRGKPLADCGGESLHGLIPAHAGKTTISSLGFSLTRAHPRSRGENVPRTSFLLRVPGSSPLTRGKPSHSRRERCGGRLIPAHAGKTSTGSRSPSPPGAHPRSRGENQDGPRQPQSVPGSSPLTRGKPREHVKLPRRQGLIPAHAGKTEVHGSWSFLSWAHPRSRGENP